jgi:hypothetical protein
LLRLNLLITVTSAANEWQLRQNDIIFSFDGDTQKRPRDKVKQARGGGMSRLAD